MFSSRHDRARTATAPGRARQRLDRARSVRVLQFVDRDVVSGAAQQISFGTHDDIFATGSPISDVYEQDSHRQPDASSIVGNTRFVQDGRISRSLTRVWAVLGAMWVRL